MKILKRVARGAVNWSLILTLPVWGGFAFLFFMLLELIDGDDRTIDVLLGKEWFLDF